MFSDDIHEEDLREHRAEQTREDAELGDWLED